MSHDSGTTVTTEATEFVVTGSQLVKGRVPQSLRRLSDFLEGYQRPFVVFEDAEVFGLDGAEIYETPHAMVARDQLVFAHEYSNEKSDRRMAVEVVWVKAVIHLDGFESSPVHGYVQERMLREPTEFFSVTQFEFRGAPLPEPLARELESADYIIVNRRAVRLLCQG